MAGENRGHYYYDLFIRKCPGHSDFYGEPGYKGFFEMCCETAGDEKSMAIIEFCNDTYGIPPVKVFIDLNRKEIDKYLAGDKGKSLLVKDKGGKDVLEVPLRRHIGSFWGAVFKHSLGHYYSTTTSVKRDEYYGFTLLSKYTFEPPPPKGK